MDRSRPVSTCVDVLVFKSDGAVRPAVLLDGLRSKEQDVPRAGGSAAGASSSGSAPLPAASTVGSLAATSLFPSATAAASGERQAAGTSGAATGSSVAQASPVLASPPSPRPQLPPPKPPMPVPGPPLPPPEAPPAEPLREAFGAKAFVDWLKELSPDRLEEVTANLGTFQEAELQWLRAHKDHAAARAMAKPVKHRAAFKVSYKVAVGLRFLSWRAADGGGKPAHLQDCCPSNDSARG